MGYCSLFVAGSAEPYDDNSNSPTLLDLLTADFRGLVGLIIKKMKRILIFAVLCLLLSVFSFAYTGLPTASNEENSIVQQNSGWEYLGDIEAVTNQNSGIRLTGSLYVRIISGKEFYQVRVKNKFSSKIVVCSVSLGSFKCWGKEYNAKFSADIDTYPGSYFFNI